MVSTEHIVHIPHKYSNCQRSHCLLESPQPQLHCLVCIASEDHVNFLHFVAWVSHLSILELITMDYSMNGNLGNSDFQCDFPYLHNPRTSQHELRSPHWSKFWVTRSSPTNTNNTLGILTKYTDHMFRIFVCECLYLYYRNQFGLVLVSAEFNIGPIKGAKTAT